MNSVPAVNARRMKIAKEWVAIACKIWKCQMTAQEGALKYTHTFLAVPTKTVSVPIYSGLAIPSTSVTTNASAPFSAIIA